MCHSIDAYIGIIVTCRYDPVLALDMMIEPWNNLVHLLEFEAMILCKRHMYHWCNQRELLSFTGAKDDGLVVVTGR